MILASLDGWDSLIAYWRDYRAGAHIYKENLHLGNCTSLKI
jgi:hypothetical protein